MNKDTAKRLVQETLQNSFDKERFTFFSKNLLNHIKETPQTIYRGNLIPDAYKPYIKTLDRIGKYEDPEKHKIDILVIHLKRKPSLERARTMQRNFIAWYLNGSRGGVLKDAALVAFVSPDKDDWRFSFVKMEYKLAETLKGNIKAKEQLTPARRYSFLVGKNETSHTAQSQFVPILVEDDHNPTLKQIEDAFGIEKVTKEFFEKYRELFLKLKEALEEIVKKDKKIKDDFEAKNVDTVDFAKKLLGQIVFLYFLQKKGWFGVARDADWGTGPKNFLRQLFDKETAKGKNFFNDSLELLFYEALAVERTDDFYGKFNCKIPFLNGGLFDPINNYDWVHTDILLPNELFSNTEKTKQGDTGTGILDVFDRYNFTVKEDEPLEKEVAVDPEMLGKVFENLLEVKDRKSKGTYYTPREIVHYMCQQSLINYLDTAVNTGKKKTIVPEKPKQNKFFGEPEHQQTSLRSGEPIVPREDITSLILHGQSALEHDTRVEIKGRETKRYPFQMPETIRKNATAIDKALESIRICDPAAGSGAFLVGMMHEIVNARQVLSTYLNGSKNRTPYDFKRDAIQNCLYGVDIDPGAVEIAKLRLWLSLIVEEEDIKQIKPLPNLDYKIVYGNSLLGVQRNLFNDQLFNELEALKPKFFDETNARKKQKVKAQIDELIFKLTNGHTDFDFEIHFSEVFHQKNGFDVAIANPPYLEARSPEFSNDIKDLAQEGAKIRWGDDSVYITRGADIMIYFLELGISLINSNGVSVFITQSSWLDTDYGKKFQSFLLKNTCVKAIIDSDFKYFDSRSGPNINTVVSIFKGKTPCLNSEIVFARFHENFERMPMGFTDIPKQIESNHVNMHTFRYSDKILKETKWGVLLSSETSVITLIGLLHKQGKQLDHLHRNKLTIGQGLNLPKSFVVGEEILNKFPFLKDCLIPFMTSKDGAPFDLRDTENYLIDQTRLTDKKQRAQLIASGIEFFDPESTRKTPPILILPRGISRHYCAMNSISAYSASGVDIYDERCNASDEIKYNLWLFLNSSVAWLLREVSGRKSLGGGLLKAEATDLRPLPIYFELDNLNRIKLIHNKLKRRKALETISEIDTPEHMEIDELVFEHIRMNKKERHEVIKLLKDAITKRMLKSKT